MSSNLSSAEQYISQMQLAVPFKAKYCKMYSFSNKKVLPPYSTQLLLEVQKSTMRMAGVNLVVEQLPIFLWS